MHGMLIDTNETEGITHKGNNEDKMNDTSPIDLYNYDEFVPEKFERWLNFAASPPLGQRAPDFPLWHLDGIQTTLHEILNQFLFTVVEFGSFT